MTSPKLARLAEPGEPGYSPNPDDCKRVYFNPNTGMVNPSITAIEGIMDKPAIPYWYAKQSAMYAVSLMVKDGFAPPDRKDKLAISELIKEIKGAAEASSQKSASKGDIIHDAIDNFAKTGEIPSAELFESWNLTCKRMWRTFLSFVDDQKPEFLHTEFTVWSDKYGYAGTGDWIAKLGRTRLVTLGDTKTGNNTWPEVGIQLSALAFGDYILYPDGTTEELPPFDIAGVLHVRPFYFELQPVKHLEQNFKTFLGLREAYMWKYFTAPSVLGQGRKVYTSKENK